MKIVSGIRISQGSVERDRHKRGDRGVYGNGGGPARNGGQELATGEGSPVVGEGEAQRRGTRTGKTGSGGAAGSSM